jgi:GAF domain-containing protein
MSESRIPSPPAKSIQERMTQLWRQLTEPAPSLPTVPDRRKAQILSVTTLILSILFILAFIVRSAMVADFEVEPFLNLLVTTLICYALSRTRFYKAGTYLLAYSFTAIAFIRIYQGKTESIEAAIVSTVHIALVFSSVLLSKRGFILLALAATVATFLAPLYGNTGEAMIAIGRTGGVVMVLGAILYGVTVFRESLEKEQRQELSETNLKLMDIRVNLEKRVEERTLEYQTANLRAQEQANRLQNITEISREITAGLNLNSGELLARITRLISEKLGYYHVGIFLLDEEREFAILRAANSKGGQEMLARGHQLKVGGTGIVGYVSQSGSPRIALDTGADAVFFNNPYLPETRSEISLPIKYANRVLGVLDVQSTQSSAFGDEDTSTLMTIANQLALIISQSGDKISASKETARHSLQINAPQTQISYTFQSDGSISANRGLPSNRYIERAAASGDTVVVGMASNGLNPILVVPVKFREKVIGVIQIESSSADRNWTEDEILLAQAVSERAALALDNAGLFEDANRRAEQEETISKITNQIGASTDFERIMQTTIQELGLALGASRSFIQIGAPGFSEKEAAE